MKASAWRAAGAALMLCGLSLAGGAAALFAHTLQRAEGQVAARTELDSACRQQMGKLGRLREENGQLVIQIDGVADPRTALGDATAALAFCPTRSVATACLGSGCAGTGGVSFILRLTARDTR